MSQFSAIGIPVSLDYKLPPSLPDSARSYQVSVSPNGITSVTGSSTVAPFVADGCMAQTAFTSQLLAFDIPAGNSSSVFLDPKETYLNFRLTHNVTTVAVPTSGAFNLISSGASFFDSLSIYHNNNPIEIVSNYGLLSHMLLNSSVNASERTGGVSIGMGADNDTATGIDLPYSALGVSYFHFSIPLISIIGLNSGEKLIPIGSIQNLQLQLQTAAFLPYASYCTALTGGAAGVLAAPILDSFALNMKFIDIGEVGISLLSQTLQNGKWFLKAATYTNSTATIPTTSSGTQSLLFQIRNSSVKSLFITNGQSVSNFTPNGQYDAINYGLTSLQCSVGGLKTPNRPLSPSLRPSESYMSFLSAWGGINMKSFGGTMSRSSYGATLPSRPTGSDNMIVAITTQGVRPNSATDTAFPTSIVKFPSTHYIGFDLEKCGGTIFSGVSTRSAPPYIDINIANPVANAVTSNCWALSDLVLVVDVNEKSITAFA